MNIRLGHDLASLQPTLHNGPGWRLNLWTQGCRHRCTDQCINPHFLDPTAGFLFPVVEVIEAVRFIRETSPVKVEGITVLGGEPFEQAGAIAEILTALRGDGLSTMVYSGHTLEYLRCQADVGIQRLLEVSDILVDGPYLPHRADERLAWRGSANQRLLCLTSRYRPEQLEQAFTEQGKGFSILVLGGRISVSGLQSWDGAANLASRLRPEAEPVKSKETGNWSPV